VALHEMLPTEAAEKVHEEHAELRCNLEELDRALNRLHCDLGLPGDLSGVSEVRSVIRRFQAFLPLHFRRQEKSLLEKVSDVTPELMELTRQLKQEHQYLTDFFAAFADSAKDLEQSDDVPGGISRAKLLGGAFTNQFRRDIRVEENELAGFL